MTDAQASCLPRSDEERTGNASLEIKLNQTSGI